MVNRAVMALTQWISLIVTALLCMTAHADQVLLTFDQYSEELAIRDATPRLTIYESGLVVTYRPSYWREPGWYEHRLSDDEMDALMDSIDAIDWAEWSSEKLATEIAQRSIRKQARDGVLIDESDATVVDFDIGGAHQKRLIVENLSSKTLELPKLALLTSLSVLERRLRQIAKDPRQQKENNALPLSELEP